MIEYTDYALNRLLVLCSLFDISETSTYRGASGDTKMSMLGDEFLKVVKRHKINNNEQNLNLIRLDVYLFCEHLFEQEDNNTLH